MALIRSRQALVGSRTQLVNHVPKGRSSPSGPACPSAPPEASTSERPSTSPRRPWAGPGAHPGLDRSLTERIRQYNRQLETVCEEHYLEHSSCVKSRGSGSLTALTFADRGGSLPLRESRSVGDTWGSCPPPTNRGRGTSKRISKEGDQMLRKLLVGSAHYVLGPFGSDSDLRRHAEKIASRGGKSAKKRAAVAT